MPNLVMPSVRADVLTRRTYNRPLHGSDTQFETWVQTIERVIYHQEWLWERAQGSALDDIQRGELSPLQALMLARQGAMSGRTTWLGGTEISRRRESSMFNCAFTQMATIHDSVDTLWLLLQGCGVGFEPIPGTLNGFARPIPEITSVRSTRTEKGGLEHNVETYDSDTGTWTIKVGDSAEAWAKSIGKLLAGKYPARRLVLDFSEIRPAGTRLKGYGWISSGDVSIEMAYLAIAAILKRRAGCLLTHMDILDIINWLGTILSSRRSSEIAIYPHGAPGWEEFACAKYEADPANPKNPQRSQSNNTLKFYDKPNKRELTNIFDMIVANGGSEPGLLNVAEMQRRAPWAVGVNPCQPAFATLWGESGLTTMGEIQPGDKIWTESGFAPVLNKWSTGVRPVFAYVTHGGTFVGTSNHRVVVGGTKVEVAYARAIDHLPSPADTGGALGTLPIVDLEFIGDLEVFDITVGNPTHTYWTGGCNVSNCGEILLANKGFCNLSELNIGAFNSMQEMQNAAYILGRANYRQTCVHLDDGILQRAWHENNEFLRLCGVGLTGIVRRDDMTDHDFISLKNAAVTGTHSMADELGLPRPKNTTTIKPSGTMSKCYDTTEGAHRPMGRYIFNNVIFSRFSEQLEGLRNAGYAVRQHPFNADDVLVTLPVEWPDVKFGAQKGCLVNTESAIDQLERYKRMMRTYVEQNCSITVSYDKNEVKNIVNWLDKNWDNYVGVSFLPRTDPTKTAHELGYPYLPQEVVTEAAFKAYTAKLKPVELAVDTAEAADDELECATGACPVK